MFLDACRDNPFAAKIRSARATRSVNVDTGLAEMKSGEGTLIAFATGPGQTALDGDKGTNSPFTRALVANIAQPGVEIQQAMTKVRAQVNEETNKNQLPWGHTNLIGSVYLNPVRAAGRRRKAEAPNTPTAAATPASDVEVEFWRSVKDSSKPEELNAYSPIIRTAPSRRWRWPASPRCRRPGEPDPQSDRRDRPGDLPMKPTRSPRTRSAWTRASAATCSAA